MRNEPNLRAEKFKRDCPEYYGPKTPPGVNWGYFEIPKPSGLLRIISSGTPDPDQPQWEHVSVSLANRCPTWEEMCAVKDIFWKEDETVIQFHPRRLNYVNRMPYCLHLWRKVGLEEHELPPSGCV